MFPDMGEWRQEYQVPGVRIVLMVLASGNSCFTPSNVVFTSSLVSLM